MKKLFLTLTLSLSFLALLSGQGIERKIVIEKGRFYYTTIDEQFQVATLHTGSFSEPLKSSKRLAMPAGRNYDDPINPFSWDISGGNVFAVNFLMHPMNDRNEALKKIELATLKEWTESVKVMDLIMTGVDATPFAYNDPYRFVISRSNTLNNFFFDGISLPDGSYWMVITNNGELSVWVHDGIAWKHGAVQQVPVSGYFSLCAKNKELFMLLNDGSIKKISSDMSASDLKPAAGNPLSEGFLVVNKDDNTVKFIKNNQLDQGTPLNELIQKKATGLF